MTPHGTGSPGCADPGSWAGPPPDVPERTHVQCSGCPVSRGVISDGWRNNGSPSEGVKLPESRYKFLYERLGDHDFQLLVNALLTERFSDFTPLPLRQSDGGRDGVRVLRSAPERHSFTR